MSKDFNEKEGAERSAERKLDELDSNSSIIGNAKANVLRLYEKIESIKTTISMANGDRPELWIQRQNLQDLYHQIILSDIDFTIDKKLEQDLWNYVFKTQINYFQSQIKENSSSLPISSGTSSSGAGTSGSVGSSAAGGGIQSKNLLAMNKTKSSNSAQKKFEAQASLSFFLEAARGFYTKLLEDIVLTYDLNELKSEKIDYINHSSSLASFCSIFPSIFDKINAIDSHNKDTKTTKEPLQLQSSSTKEKQVLYICQHILTHLGDIARYANLSDQAENYYLHSIKLVPYLGHPYNQLGILFETSRTNQLSTVFYYIRSIALRYTFPLASTNLENFFHKLIDIPMARYNPNPGGNSAAAKLAHKDLITLYLQINGIIHACVLNNKYARSLNCSKLNSYFDFFKSAFGSFMESPLQRDKLDSMQLNQMMAILIYVLTLNTQNKPAGSSSSNIKLNANSATGANTALELFYFFIDQLVCVYNSSSSNSSDEKLGELVLPSLNLAFSFIEHFQDGQLISSNKLWLFKTDSDSASKFCHSTMDMLNDLDRKLKSYLESIEKTASSSSFMPKFKPDNYNDYPLGENRMLDSFMPLSQAHKDYSFKKYMKNSKLLSETNESLLRKQRITQCFSRIVSKDQAVCFVKINTEDPKFSASLSCPPLPKTEPKETQNESLVKAIPDNSPKLSEASAENEAKLEQQQQQPRRRRQNVAISSMLNSNQHQIKDAEPKQISKPVFATTPDSLNKMVSNIVVNANSSSSSPSPSLSTSSTSSNGTIIMEQSLKNKPFASLNTAELSAFPQASFFPSASVRQFNQSTNQNNSFNQQMFNRPQPSFNQAQSLNNSFNGFPSFLPNDKTINNYQNSQEMNTKEKISQLNKKLQMQQSHQTKDPLKPMFHDQLSKSQNQAQFMPNFSYNQHQYNSSYNDQLSRSMNNKYPNSNEFLLSNNNNNLNNQKNSLNDLIKPKSNSIWSNEVNNPSPSSNINYNDILTNRLIQNGMQNNFGDNNAFNNNSQLPIWPKQQQQQQFQQINNNSLDFNHSSNSLNKNIGDELSNDNLLSKLLIQQLLANSDQATNSFESQNLNLLNMQSLNLNQNANSTDYSNSIWSYPTLNKK